MLSTVTLAASQDLVPVWFGSTLGMVISDGLAIWVGRVLGKQLPERTIKIGAAAIFVGFGLFYTVGDWLSYGKSIASCLIRLLFKETLVDLFHKRQAGQFKKHRPKLRLMGIADAEVFFPGTPDSPF